jgi:hypothetical protein
LGFTLGIHKRKRVASKNWTINKSKERGGKRIDIIYNTVSEIIIIIKSQGKGFPATQKEECPPTI